jgi:hypothetical protein
VLVAYVRVYISSINSPLIDVPLCAGLPLSGISHTLHLADAVGMVTSRADRMGDSEVVSLHAYVYIL